MVITHKYDTYRNRIHFESSPIKRLVFLNGRPARKRLFIILFFVFHIFKKIDVGKGRVGCYRLSSGSDYNRF